MNTASIKLYDILVEKGVDRTVAREAVNEFITRDEAEKVLATKDDIRKIIMWMAGLMTGQVGVFAAIVAAFG